MGRPQLPIDADQVFKIARLGCTNQEIADILGCSTDTIERRFAGELSSARASRKMSLRRAQTVRAIRDRSDTMLIHLGKTELGQRDKLDVNMSAQPLFETFDDGRDPNLPTPGEAT